MPSSVLPRDADTGWPETRCNEFITMSGSETRFNGAHERAAKASFFMARLTSNVR